MISIIFLALTISGCATTPAGLEKPEYAHQFVVDQPYQTTLKNIVEANAECQTSPLFPLGQIINDIHDYSNLKEAKIVHGASGVGTQIYKVISVKEINSKSNVVFYSKASKAGEIFLRLQRWAIGSKDCSL